jgi:hypothetical protein
VNDHNEDDRTRRRRVALGVIAAKLAIVALLLVLPSGLAIGFGAAHGVALLIAAVTAALLLVFKRDSSLPFLRHRPHGPDVREEGEQ